MANTTTAAARYTIKSTGNSSSKYGNCEVCGRHCSDVAVQGKNRIDYVFGHKKCLERLRQLEVNANG